MYNVIIGVELSKEEDRMLKIEAAKEGLSKRKFARKIIIDWLNNRSKTLREIYEDIINTAGCLTDNEEKNQTLDLLMNFIDSCTELVQLIVLEHSTGEQARKQEVINKINSTVCQINQFCMKHNISTLPQLPAEQLAFDIIDNYNPTGSQEPRWNFRERS